MIGVSEADESHEGWTRSDASTASRSAQHAQAPPPPPRREKQPTNGGGAGASLCHAKPRPPHERRRLAPSTMIEGPGAGRGGKEASSPGLLPRLIGAAPPRSLAHARTSFQRQLSAFAHPHRLRERSFGCVHERQGAFAPRARRRHGGGWYRISMFHPSEPRRPLLRPSSGSDEHRRRAPNKSNGWRCFVGTALCVREGRRSLWREARGSFMCFFWPNFLPNAPTK